MVGTEPEPVDELLFRFPIAPKPSHRFGHNGSAVDVVVAASTIDKLKVVAAKLERGSHFLIGKWPISKLIIQVATSILKENADRLLRSFSNHGRIVMTTAQIHKATDVAEHLSKHVGAFPSDRERADTTGTDSTDSPHLWIVG